MKVFEYKFDDQEKTFVKKILKSTKSIKIFILSFSAFLATTLTPMAPTVNNAHAESLLRTIYSATKKVVDPTHLAGAAAGAYTSSKKDSDLERGAKVAAGVIGSEAVKSAVTGKKADWYETTEDALVGFVGGMLRSDKDSDSKAALKAMAAIGGYRVAKKFISVNFDDSKKKNKKDFDRARTKCRLVTKRVYKNGKLVSETVEEICSAEAVKDNAYSDRISSRTNRKLLR